MLVLVEARRRQLHGLDGIEWDRERADADLRRGRSLGLGRQPPADEVLDDRAQDLQRLVDRRRLRVVARIEPDAALPCPEQHEPAPERAVEQRVAQVGARHVEAEQHAGAADVLQNLRVVARQRGKALARPLPRRAHLREIQLVEQRDQPHHADRIAFPRRVEFLLFLEERRERFADEQHAVLRLLRPGDEIRRARQVEQLVRPEAARHPPARLHFVEDQRHPVDARQEAQLPHEARARHADAAFALNRLDQHRRHAPRPPDDVGAQTSALRLHEGVHVLARRGQELVDGVHLAAIGVAALVRMRQPAGDEQIPQLLQAALLAPRRLFRRTGVEERKRDVRPVKGGKPEARAAAVRDRQASKRPAVERALERNDEAAFAVARGHHPVQQHRLDGVLDRLGAGVHDEMARRTGRRNPIQLRFQPERQHGLVFGMRIPRGDERQRLEDGGNHVGIVFAERLRGNERSHVEESIRLVDRIAIDGGEVGPDRLGRIERHRQREKEAARRRRQRRMRRGKVLFDQFLQRALAVAQRLGHIRVDGAGTVAVVERADVREVVQYGLRTADGGLRGLHVRNGDWLRSIIR